MQNVFTTRRNWLGQLILQQRMSGGWQDAKAASPHPTFELLPAGTTGELVRLQTKLSEQEERIGRFDRKSKAQKLSRMKRKAPVLTDAVSGSDAGVEGDAARGDGAAAGVDGPGDGAVG